MTPAEQMDLLRIADRRAHDGSGRRIRIQANVPMRLLADHLNVSIPTICRWEKGERRPSGDAGIGWVLWLEMTERSLKSDARLAAVA